MGRLLELQSELKHSRATTTSAQADREHMSTLLQELREVQHNGYHLIPCTCLLSHYFYYFITVCLSLSCLFLSTVYHKVSVASSSVSLNCLSRTMKCWRCRAARCGRRLRSTNFESHDCCRTTLNWRRRTSPYRSWCPHSSIIRCR